MGLVSFTTFGRHYGLAKDDDNIFKNTIIHPAMTKPQQMGPTNCGPHIGSTEYHHIIHRVSLEGTFVKSAWIRNSLWAPVSFYELKFRRRAALTKTGLVNGIFLGNQNFNQKCKSMISSLNNISRYGSESGK